MRNTATKYLLIFLALVFILVVTISYRLYLKKSAPQTNPAVTPESGQQEETAAPPAPMVNAPAEAQIGTVMDVAVQSDGKVKITVGEKTYLLPADQKVKLYTSGTETTSIPISQLKQGTTVNVIKFTNPDRYEVIGVTDKALTGKLI